MNALTLRLSKTQLPPLLRFAALVLLYAVTCTISLRLAYLLRFDFAPQSCKRGQTRMALS